MANRLLRGSRLIRLLGPNKRPDAAQFLSSLVHLVQIDGPDTAGLQCGAWESWFTWSTDVIACCDFDGALPEVINVNGVGLSDILCAYRYSGIAMSK